MTGNFKGNLIATEDLHGEKATSTFSDFQSIQTSHSLLNDLSLGRQLWSGHNAIYKFQFSNLIRATHMR